MTEEKSTCTARRIMRAFMAAGFVFVSTHGLGTPGGAMAGGSTELTQLLNHVELLASVSKQTDMVMEQVQSKLASLEQLDRMNRNLSRLANGDIAQTLLPYQNQVESYQALRRSVSGLRDAAGTTRQLLQQRGVDFSRSGAKNWSSYIQYEVELAKRRGGVYSQRLDQDLRAMDNMQQRSREFRRVADTSDVAGNIQGLQRLSQLSAIATGELMELKAAVLSQSADSNRQQADAAASAQLRARIQEATMRGALERTKRDEAMTAPNIDPLRPWPNLIQGN